MFHGAKSFQGTGLFEWGVNQLNAMPCMFANAVVMNANLSSWDIANVQDMSSMFSGAKSFVGVGLEHWDVSNVIDMSSMFFGAESFLGNGLEFWVVIQVRKMDHMFSNAQALNTNSSSWDAFNIQNMWTMFVNTSSFQGVAWYKNFLLHNFQFSRKDEIYCSAGIGTFCQASISCWCSTAKNHDDVITDWKDFVNEMIPYPYSNIDTTNITDDTNDGNNNDEDANGIMKIAGNEYFSFTFPNNCVQ
jgi:surface protein